MAALKSLSFLILACVVLATCSATSNKKCDCPERTVRQKFIDADHFSRVRALGNSTLPDGTIEHRVKALIHFKYSEKPLPVNFTITSPEVGNPCYVELEEGNVYYLSINGFHIKECEYVMNEKIKGVKVLWEIVDWDPNSNLIQTSIAE